MAKLALSIPEVAEQLGISTWLAYRMASDGRLPTIPAGRRRVVPKAALERMLLGEAS